MIHGLEMLCVCQGPYVQGLLSIKAPLAKWSFLDVQITRVWTFIWTHKGSMSYHQFEFVSTLMSLYPPFGLRQLFCMHPNIQTCIFNLDKTQPSKWTIQICIIAPSIRTVEINHSPMDC